MRDSPSRQVKGGIVKLLPRRLFNILAVLSLLLGLALAWILDASYWYAGLFQREFLRSGETAIQTRQVSAEIGWGSLLIEERYGRMTRPVADVGNDGLPRGERTRA